jgi:C-terminal processing protease CtpA/Prc
MPLLIALFLTCVSSTFGGQSVSHPPSAVITPDTVRVTVTEIAAIISREYMDATIGGRLADSLLRRLNDGEYADATTPAELAALVNGDLLEESQDKHLSVAVIREPAKAPAAAPAGHAREDNVRRTNAGVQRVEILPGNVGYLNLTAFWRIEEAREAIGDAMRLLRRADALIIDMRQNGGGSPETVAFVAGYLFGQPGLPLFDIVPRSGERVTYATPTPAPAERDQRRPMFVLTASRTFSAGEGFAFLLQERTRAVVIGERTSGAANPGRPYPVNALFEVTVPNGQVRSSVSGRNWEGAGVAPDISVPASDALRVAHERALGELTRRVR